MGEDVCNEFGSVRLEVQHAGNGAVLAITDLKSGAVAFYDPLELETLVYLSRADRTHLLDPATTRWADGSETSDESESAFGDRSFDISTKGLL